MLAGHDQSGGEVIERNGEKFKLFYGMSSSTAMEKYYECKDYRYVNRVSEIYCWDIGEGRESCQISTAL